MLPVPLLACASVTDNAPPLQIPCMSTTRSLTPLETPLKKKKRGGEGTDGSYIPILPQYRDIVDESCGRVEPHDSHALIFKLSLTLIHREKPAIRLYKETFPLIEHVTLAIVLL